MSAKNVFDLSRRRSWLNSIRYYAADILSYELRMLLKHSRPDCWSDNFQWLPSYDIVESFEDSFRSYYSHIRAFHACRPAEMSSYIENGIAVQNQNQLQNKFREIFSEISADKFNNALQKNSFGSQVDQGKSYYSLFKNTLVEDAGHYLIYGSEYTLALIGTLAASDYEKRQYQRRLKTIGIPTLFEVEIPISYVPLPQLTSLVKVIISEWGQLVTKKPLGRCDEFCISLHRPLEARYITQHSHPPLIIDPLCNHSNYRNHMLSCKYCC